MTSGREALELIETCPPDDRRYYLGRMQARVRALDDAETPAEITERNQLRVSIAKWGPKI